MSTRFLRFSALSRSAALAETGKQAHCAKPHVSADRRRGEKPRRLLVPLRTMCLRSVLPKELDQPKQSYRKLYDGGVDVPIAGAHGILHTNAQ
jgi:hypothetical protein